MRYTPAFLQKSQHESVYDGDKMNAFARVITDGGVLVFLGKIKASFGP